MCKSKIMNFSMQLSGDIKRNLIFKNIICKIKNSSMVLRKNKLLVIKIFNLFKLTAIGNFG